MSETTKKPVYKKWWFWLVVLIVIAAIGQGGKDGKQSGESNTSTKGAKAEDAMSNLPADQRKFIEITQDAQAKARSAENDMQKGGVKAERDKLLCASLPSLSVKDWIGKVDKIDANSDGKGVVSIEIAKNILVKTWNNDLSDLMDHTLINPGTPLFNAASQLKKGARVKFSGSFFNGGDGDCVKESSLSLSGKVKEPEFIFRFEGISPL